MKIFITTFAVFLFILIGVDIEINSQLKNTDYSMTFVIMPFLMTSIVILINYNKFKKYIYENFEFLKED